MNFARTLFAVLSVAALASCASFSSSGVDVYVGKNGVCRINGKNVKLENVPDMLEREGVPFDTTINIKGDAVARKQEIRRLLWTMTRSKYHDTRIVDTRVRKTARPR